MSLLTVLAGENFQYFITTDKQVCANIWSLWLSWLMVGYSTLECSRQRIKASFRQPKYIHYYLLRVRQKNHTDRKTDCPFRLTQYICKCCNVIRSWHLKLIALWDVLLSFVLGYVIAVLILVCYIDTTHSCVIALARFGRNKKCPICHLEYVSMTGWLLIFGTSLKKKPSSFQKQLNCPPVL